MPNVSDELREGLSRLSPKDQAFAQSLLSARRPSNKQMHWIGILAERTKLPDPTAKPERESVVIGDMAPIIRMFDHYREHHVKTPKIVLSTGHGLIVAYPAGEGSQYPGCVQVKEYDGQGRWFGRIYRDGRFELSPKYKAEDMTHVTGILTALCADPIATATAHGRLTGRCCFCHIRLKDERSTEMGYGPVCAESFGLDWGSRKFAFANTPTAVVQSPAPIAKSRRRIKVGV